MSIDINWDTITSGPEGEALAEKIRLFIHERFQHIELPRFINSVVVHSFEFGKECPEIEIKDIGDPLPDFYDDDDDDDNGEDGVQQHPVASNSASTSTQLDREQLHSLQSHILQHEPSLASIASAHHGHRAAQLPPQLETSRLPPFHLADSFPRSGTPGIPGGTSNLSYFHLPLGNLSGTQTPLAAVASGTPFASSGWPQTDDLYRAPLDQPADDSTRPSTANTATSPSADLGSPFSLASPTRHAPYVKAEKVSDDIHAHPDTLPPHAVDHHLPPFPPSPPQTHPTDTQLLLHIRYTGSLSLSLTASLLLDYPMPSFLTIPLKLSITGLTFDGVAVLVTIKHRMHFCFLSPEDAAAMLGPDANTPASGAAGPAAHLAGAGQGGLLREIKVESEIGRQAEGRQVLRNVEKVERFVLEQVRRIFEDEVVWPSFWTFLV